MVVTAPGGAPADRRRRCLRSSSSLRRLGAAALLSAAAVAPWFPAAAQNTGAAPDVSAVSGALETELAGDGLTSESVTANFLRVVFDLGPVRLSLDPTLVGSESILAKWSDPVFYRVVGDAAERDDALAVVLLSAEIEEATGLTIRPATGATPANITVFILTQEVRDSLGQQVADAVARGEIERADPTLQAWLSDENVACAASVRLDEDRIGAIIEGLVMVKGEADIDTRDLCVQREYLRAFGLSNAHEDVAPSILNPLDAQGKPTDQDFQLLSVLYDPRLTPGLTRAEAEPIAADVVAEIRAAELAAQADASPLGTQRQ